MSYPTEYHYWIDSDGFEQCEPVCSVCGKCCFEEETTFLPPDDRPVCCNCIKVSDAEFENVKAQLRVFNQVLSYLNPK
jgi:hypothetical protein